MTYELEEKLFEERFDKNRWSIDADRDFEDEKHCLIDYIDFEPVGAKSLEEVEEFTVVTTSQVRREVTFKKKK